MKFYMLEYKLFGKNENILSLYFYIKVRIKNIFRRNRYFAFNLKPNLPIKSIKIISSFFNPFRDEEWEEFIPFLKNYTKYILLKKHDPYLDIPLFDSFEVGGFLDIIVMNIISNFVYEKGKEFIKGLLLKIQNSSNNYTSDAEHESGMRNSKIIIKFIDDKNVIINLPFPAKRYGKLENIDFNIIETQFQKSNIAIIDFDVKDNVFKKGKVIDIYK